MDRPDTNPEFKGRRKHRTEEWTRKNYIHSQIRGDGKLRINVEWRTWDGLEFTGVIVLLKSKVIGRKKIGYLCPRENLRFNDNYNLKELYNSIIHISNISCQRRNTDYVRMIPSYTNSPPAEVPKQWK
jgi:hypothetical protein